MECDLTLSRKHLEKAVALHKEVRTYRERVAPLGEMIDKPLVELKSGVKPLGEGQRITGALYRYRATFEKGEGIKYLSHLDLTRALPRAFRRAGILLGYSQGFHPMPLIQYGPALGVGTVGENELIDFDSPDNLVEIDFLDRINRVLPEGFRFKSLERLQPGAKALIKEFNRAEYSVPLDSPEIVEAVARARESRGELRAADEIEIHDRLASEFMARDSVVIERARKEKKQQIDVRRYTVRLAADAEGNRLRIVTELSPNGGAKPTEILAAIYGMKFEEVIPLSSRVRRLRLFFENQAGPDAQIEKPPIAAHASGD
jgi:radical SAM-linked protein